MTEQQSPAPEAGDDAVVPDEQVTPEAEAPEAETEGQVETPTADAEEEPEAEEKKSRHQARRERHKAHVRELEAKAKNATEAKERIRKAAQGIEEPKRDDFEDPDDYTAAKAAYFGAKSINDREERILEDEASSVSEQINAEVMDMWRSQVDDARSRYSDFDQVALTAPISDSVAEMIRRADQGADVAYYLGQNRAEASRISQMNPIEAAMALGRIEATLSLPKPQRKTTAPPPIEPVKGGAPATKSPDEMSMSEYVAARKAGKI